MSDEDIKPTEYTKTRKIFVTFERTITIKEQAVITVKVPEFLQDDDLEDALVKDLPQIKSGLQEHMFKTISRRDITKSVGVCSEDGDFVRGRPEKNNGNN